MEGAGVGVTAWAQWSSVKLAFAAPRVGPDGAAGGRARAAGGWAAGAAGSCRGGAGVIAFLLDGHVIEGALEGISGGKGSGDASPPLLLLIHTYDVAGRWHDRHVGRAGERCHLLF